MKVLNTVREKKLDSQEAAYLYKDPEHFKEIYGI